MRTKRLLHVSWMMLVFTGIAAAADAPYLRDRGPGVKTSIFGTYVQKGEVIIYPFWEYYYNPDEEYKPAELGHGLEQDFTSEFRANESLLFLAYGVTDRLAVEVEAASISAELNKAPTDPSSMPGEWEESGLGDVQTQINYVLKNETLHSPAMFSYFEVVYPFNKDKTLIGTSDYELKLGAGLLRGFNWGTVAVRAGIDHARAENKTELGEVAIEYLKRWSPHWRTYAGVEGVQDEIELISEFQYHLVTDRIIVKFNNAIGLTPKSPNWAPEYGVMFVL